jgi:hypothetical protein
VIYPYLFHVADCQQIRLDWEHKESRWIRPREIIDYQTVPDLKEALESVMQKGNEK